MAMLKLGARGTTAQEIQNSMKFPEDDDSLINSWQSLLSTFQVCKKKMLCPLYFIYHSVVIFIVIKNVPVRINKMFL